MQDSFLVSLQVTSEPLMQALTKWLSECAGLSLCALESAPQFCVMDWPQFSYFRQLGHSFVIPTVVIAPEYDAYQEQQVFISGGIDYVGGADVFDNLVLRLSSHIQRVQKLDHLESLSVTDTLTGLFNRRKFEQAREMCWRQGVRQQTPCSLLLLDVDYFKSFNDTYGHLAGDQCLRELAGVLMAHAVRPYDVAARIGGEEFAILLPDTPKTGAHHVAQNILSSVRDLNMLNERAPMGKVTVSIGVSTITPTHKDKAKHWQQRADDALYAAKAAGRNQVQGGQISAPSEAEIF